MKNNLLLCLIAWLGLSLSVQAADLPSLNWGQVCSGQMGAAWYDSAESQSVADIVLSVQKTNGGCESAALLSFLMTIPNPSVELQAAITAGVTWLDAHKIEGKAIEDYTNGDGVADRRIVDRPGSAIWGRFIQLGGEKALPTPSMTG